MIKEATEDNILEAAALIKQGKCVAFPTETVYGLGANALDEAAVKKIFKIKGRPSNNPIIVHLSSVKDIAQVANLKDELIKSRFESLNKFWPGPLTVIVPKKNIVPDIVTAGLKNIGVRIPSHPIALSLIKKAEVPIAAPSANSSTYVSPTQATHVADCLGEKVDIILDGGSSEIGIESTVIDISGTVPTILRPGTITKEQISEVLPDVILKDEVTKAEEMLSPGLLPKHYSPKTPVKLLSNIEISNLPEKSALVSFRSQHEADIQDAFELISPLTAHGDLKEAASRLYSTLRNLDKSGVEIIVIEDCHDKGLGQALQNRLKRASND